MRLPTTIAGFAIVLLACGGEVAGDHSSSSSGGSSGSPNAPESSAPPPPSTRSPAAPPAPPPASDAPAPTKIGDPPNDSTTTTPFHLVVVMKNGSSSAAPPVPMEIAIDDTPVVTGSFASTTYMFDFALAPGAHALTANAAFNSLQTIETFELDAAGERWGVLDVNISRCDPCSAPYMQWQVKTQP